MLLKYLLFYVFIQTANSASFEKESPENAIESPKFSDVYSLKGTLIVPNADITEPFHVWYDKPKGRYRIDYYGGMVQTYQLTKMGKFGTTFNIIPVTTEEVLNAKVCQKFEGTEDFPVHITTILPSLDNITYVGSEKINGDETQKWQYIEKNGELINKHTMWFKFRKQSKEGSSLNAIPVRYEMRAYNSVLSSLRDHYYHEYEEFNISSNIPDSVFEIPTEITCDNFNGSPSQHTYTFNPMREFIHPAQTDHVDEEFSRFIEKHNKVYDDHEDHSNRKEIFRQNMRFIMSKNRANLGYTLAANHFTDRTDAEMQALSGTRYATDYNGAMPFPYDADYVLKAKDDLPANFDWRIYGAVTPVKNQKSCGSCWAFAAVGAVEGAFFLHNGGHLTKLSEQALMDCSWGFNNNGCGGGHTLNAYKWMMKHGGIPRYEEYGGYLQEDGYCHADNVTLVAPIKGFVSVTANDENALRLAIVKHGPIAVSIDADPKTFNFYSSGVFYEPKCNNKLGTLNHAVLAVGYGTLNGQNYWLIKNSWSNLWGNDGYILMSSKDNNCGVETVPSYVQM